MNNHFNYVHSNRGIHLENNYIVATPKDIEKLNKFSSTIQHATTFFKNNLADKKIDYLYRDKNEIKLLPVLYKTINFAHLTGINYPFVDANKKFDYLQHGHNHEPILIENHNQTFKKIKLLPYLDQTLKCDSSILSDLAEIKQAQRLGFNKAIKDKNSKLLLALQNFQPTVYQPKSLINIQNSKNYYNVPEGPILAIFREEPTFYQGQQLGISAGTVDINPNLSKENAISLAGLVSKELVKEMNQNRNKSISIKLKEGKKIMNIDELKEEVENYPVIVDGFAAGTDTAYLMKLKERANDLNMSVAKGSELKGTNRDDRDSIYLIKAGINPIKMGNNLEDIINSVLEDGSLDGHRSSALPISLTKDGKVPSNSDIQKEFSQYTASVNKKANDRQFFGQQTTTAKEYLEGVNGSYAVKNNDNKWKIHPTQQALNGQIKGEWGYALKDTSKLNTLDPNAPIYAISNKEQDIYTKSDFQKSAQNILENSNSQKHAHFPIDNRSINLMTNNELEYATNSGTPLDSIEEEITNDIAGNFDAYKDISEGRWGLNKRSYVDNVTAQTQMIDFYYYDSSKDQKPQLIATDLQNLKLNLRNDNLKNKIENQDLNTNITDIKNEISAKENQKVSPREYEKYLRKYNIFMNPSREDFENANKDAGKDINSNIKNISNTPATEKQLETVYAQKFLKENGLQVNEKNVSTLAKNLSWNKEFNKAWNDANPNKPQKDISTKGAYLEETKIFNDPEFKDNYFQNYGKKNSNVQKKSISKKSQSHIQTQTTDHDLDM